MRWLPSLSADRQPRQQTRSPARRVAEDPGTSLGVLRRSRGSPRSARGASIANNRRPDRDPRRRLRWPRFTDVRRRRVASVFAAESIVARSKVMTSTARPQCPPGRIEPEHWPLELEPHVGGAATDTPAARLRIDDAQPEPSCSGLFENRFANFVLKAFALVDDLHQQAILEQLCSERDPPATVTHGVGDKL